MTKMTKKAFAVALTAAMTLTGVSVSDAKAKAPALSKTKANIAVGKTLTVKVTKAKAKKTTWSVNKAGKAVVSLSKQKKDSVVIKGKKAGKAVVSAKITVGKKSYTKKVTVTVKTKPVAPIATPTATPVATSEPTATPVVTPEPTKEPGTVDIDDKNNVDLDGDDTGASVDEAEKAMKLVIPYAQGIQIKNNAEDPTGYRFVTLTYKSEFTVTPFLFDKNIGNGEGEQWNIPGQHQADGMMEATDEWTTITFEIGDDYEGDCLTAIKFVNIDEGNDANVLLVKDIVFSKERP